MTHETALRGTLAALKKSRPTGEYAFSAEAAELHEAAIDEAEAALAVTAPVQSHDEWVKEAERLLTKVVSAEHARGIRTARGIRPDSQPDTEIDAMRKHLISRQLAAPEGLSPKTKLKIWHVTKNTRCFMFDKEESGIGSLNDLPDGDYELAATPMIAATKAGKE